MPFALKKFIAQFLMPMPLVCESFLLGWALCRFTRFKKVGAALKVFSLILFVVFGNGMVRNYVYRLERHYPPFAPSPEQCEELRGVSVVVLGQGLPEQSDLPLLCQNTPVFERRLFEGVRVAKLIPESRLIVSMPGAASATAKRAFLSDYLRLVNFPTNRLAMFTDARDTSEESRDARPLIHANDSAARAESEGTSARANTHVILLVTSAAHLPRSMKIFRKQGLSPIAAPCDYTEVRRPVWTFTETALAFPSGSNFEASGNAIHEWLGNLFEDIAGK